METDSSEEFAETNRLLFMAHGAPRQILFEPYTKTLVRNWSDGPWNGEPEIEVIAFSEEEKLATMARQEKDDVFLKALAEQDPDLLERIHLQPTIDREVFIKDNVFTAVSVTRTDEEGYEYIHHLPVIALSSSVRGAVMSNICTSSSHNLHSS